MNNQRPRTNQTWSGAGAVVDMKRSQIKILMHAERNWRLNHAGLRRMRPILLAFGLVLCWLQPTPAQPQPQTQLQPQPSTIEQEKTRLEVQKLQIEIAKLQQTESEWIQWNSILLGLLGGVVGALSSSYLARRARQGAIDQATHEKRLCAYSKLIKATSPLALYFPGCGKESIGPLDAGACQAMGREMSEWYFDGGGLLLSTEARDAYFRLTRALTHASFASGLRVPKFPDDAEDISKEKVDEYARELGQTFTRALNNVDDWTFGGSTSKTDNKTPKPERFQDYVFLQQLSSQLRTALANDLRSRRRLS